jgi:sulfatase maturation enzyme AslB (radical SAM superfamily)
MLTTACNFRCRYCTQTKGAPRTMAPGVLDAAVRRLASSRFHRPALILYGGEPLLAAPLVRRALDRVRQWAPPRMEPDIQVSTNGTQLDEEMSRLLASLDVSVLLSFDGVAAAQDDRCPGSFEQLDRLLVRLRRDHPKHFRDRLAVKITLTARNTPFLSDSFRYFLARDVRSVDVYPALPDDAGWNGSLRHRLARELAEVVRLSRTEFRRSGRIPFRFFRGGAGQPPPAGAPACGCGSRGVLFVDIDGTLAPCARLAPATLGPGPQPEAIRRAVTSLRGLRISDRGLAVALLRREKRARRLPFLAGPETRQGPRGPCATCKALPTCFVCPVAVACNGGRVPQFHCDVNWLLARHRKAFQAAAREPSTFQRPSLRQGGSNVRSRPPQGRGQ